MSEIQSFIPHLNNAISDIPEDIMSDAAETAWCKFLGDTDCVIEYLLRNHIRKPIKREVTFGKLRWRGISLVQSPVEVTWEIVEESGDVRVETSRAIFGLRERNDLVLLDGKRIEGYFGNKGTP